MTNRIGLELNQQSAQLQKMTAQPAGLAFDALLQQSLASAQPPVEARSPLAFSKHAMARAEQRGIQIDDALMSQLSDSVEKAQSKGAKNILAFDATRAFIVNIPNCRVITAMSQEELKENVFTNIDGAVIL